MFVSLEMGYNPTSETFQVEHLSSRISGVKSCWPNVYMYRNVVVAISPDTPSTSSNEAIVEGIKEWITQGNEKLHAATRDRVAIGHVSILIPSSWTYHDAKTTSQTTFEVRKRTLSCKTSHI